MIPPLVTCSHGAGVLALPFVEVVKARAAIEYGERDADTFPVGIDGDAAGVAGHAISCRNEINRSRQVEMRSRGEPVTGQLERRWRMAGVATELRQGGGWSVRAATDASRRPHRFPKIPGN